MNLKKIISNWWLDVMVLVVVVIVFVVPFIFIVLTASKTRIEASEFKFTLPTQFVLFDNLRDVILFNDNRMLLAMKNSLLITIGSVVLVVLLAAMVAFVLQRRQDRVASVISSVALAGLVIPPAVVPTIFLMQWLHIYKTQLGIILIHVVFTMPFAITIFKAFIGTIPSELDEAAIIDGASPQQVFFKIILPLLRPAIITVIVVSGVGIYNDFASSLYFLPGDQNVTVQLTLFSYMSQFVSRWNLLFANVIIVTLPPLILFVFFQRQLVSGMTAGAVKG